MTSINPLDKYTSSELKNELARREEEIQETIAMERKSREILVECPNCNGTGKFIDISQITSYYDSSCGMCKGRGEIVAHRKV